MATFRVPDVEVKARLSQENHGPNETPHLFVETKHLSGSNAQLRSASVIKRCRPSPKHDRVDGWSSGPLGESNGLPTSDRLYVDQRDLATGTFAIDVPSWLTRGTTKRTGKGAALAEEASAPGAFLARRGAAFAATADVVPNRSAEKRSRFISSEHKGLINCSAFPDRPSSGKDACWPWKDCHSGACSRFEFACWPQSHSP